MKMPGFEAEASLHRHKATHRVLASDNRNDSGKIIPQMSCWRTCYDSSSTNHELSDCYRVCSQLKRIFMF